MILAVSKYGAFYLAERVSYEPRLDRGKSVMTAVLYGALFLRRAKRVVSFQRVYLVKRSVALLTELPADLLLVDSVEAVELYNQVHDFVTSNGFDSHIKKLPARIPVTQIVTSASEGGDLNNEN